MMPLLAWLLTYSIHSTILLGCAALVAWRFHDHHAWLDPIWKIALIAPIITASVNLEAVTPTRARWTMPPVTTAGATVTETAPSREEAPVAAGDRVTTNRRTVARSEPRPNRFNAVTSKLPMVGAILWLTLAIALVARYAVRLRRAYRTLRAGSPVTSRQVLDAIDQLRAGQHPVRVTTNSHCRVPLALSGNHIVLPPQFFDHLDPEQQRAALAHELAHVVRRDPQWRIVVDLIERALFFQPLNYFARARLCDSAEFLCDEWAVRHTQSPLAMARCLSIVASWWTPADALPAGVSPMARSDSAMVRRVTRILDTPLRSARPRLFWLAIPVALVATAAPRVTATQLPAAAVVTPAIAAAVNAAAVEKVDEQRDNRQWTVAEIAAARAQRRVYRLDRSGTSLDQRWQEALADASRQRFGDFWIAYSFMTPTHAGDMMISDSRDGGTWFSDGRVIAPGPPLSELINPTAVLLEGGNVVVLLHYRDHNVDRAGYRSAHVGFDFGRTPVFWLGDAPEAESFARVEGLFAGARDRKIQTLLIELASLHSNSNVVIPFLTRLVDPKWPAEIRQEAAEGFDHHHDPRSVEVLLRVARTDTDSQVRAEAAETIGEVQTPQSIPALIDLVNNSPDPDVRREAAEGFGDQPADRALPAIEKVVADVQDEDALNEAIEAVGDLHDQAGLPLLMQIANTHRNVEAQKEAVETIGDLDVPGIVEALTRIAWEHPDTEVQKEAVETLGDRQDDAGAIAAVEKIAREHDREEVQAEAIETITDFKDQALHPLLLELAVSGKSARVRRQAIESIGDAVSKTGDAQVLDRAQTAIEHAVFDDPDRSVQTEAIDALDQFPNDRALRVLRDIVARHPDTRIRREAEEHRRERQ